MTDEEKASIDAQQLMFGRKASPKVQRVQRVHQGENPRGIIKFSHFDGESIKIKQQPFEIDRIAGAEYTLELEAPLRVQLSIKVVSFSPLLENFAENEALVSATFYTNTANIPQTLKQKMLMSATDVTLPKFEYSEQLWVQLKLLFERSLNECYLNSPPIS